MSLEMMGLVVAGLKVERRIGERMNVLILDESKLMELERGRFYIVQHVLLQYRCVSEYEPC